MSLRDQLLKAGVVTKKDVRRAEHDLRTERKSAQGSKARASEIEAAQRAAQAAAEAEANARRVAQRREREAAREAAERAHQVSQIIQRNSLRGRGKLRYHFRVGASAAVARIDVHEKIAWKLRCGEVAIVRAGEDPSSGDPIYAVVSIVAAERLDQLAPGVVVHRVRDTAGVGAKEERFVEPDWEVSLRPHRLRPDAPR